MRRILIAVMAAVALTTGLVAGCGIPDHTEVKTEDRGPVAGSDHETSPPGTPKERQDATSPAEFVANFLEAPAGEFETSRPRVQQYMAPELRDSVTFKPGVAVVEVLGSHWDVNVENKVTITVRHLGLLNADGEILRPTEMETQYTLEFGEIEGASPGFFMTKAPQVTLMNVDALPVFYTQRTVYFWNADHTALIPDLRWLPTDVSPGRVPTELLKMIERGPSPWLGDVASPLPEGSKLIINAPQEGNQLTMNWSPQSVDNGSSEDYLAQQVAWTLGPAPPAKLNLKINGQLQKDYDTVSLQAQLPYPVGRDVNAFAVLDGKIRALAGPAATLPSPLTGAADQNVRWAAFSRSGDQLLGAVVGDKNTVVGDKNTTLFVGSATDGSIDTLSPVRGIVATSPPTWIPRAKIGLVTTADGLYTFAADGTSKKVAPTEIPGTVTSVAAAPEGHRIAVIADRKLFVVALSITQDGTLAFEPPRPLVAPLVSLTAVAWTGETSLAVGGTSEETNRPAIVDLSIDGVRHYDRTLDARATVTMIAAYPENQTLDRSSAVMYGAGNQTWSLRPPQPIPVERANLAGETPQPSPSSGNPPPSQPTAPFYIY